MIVMKTITILSILILSGCLSNPTDGNEIEIEELNLLWEYAYNLDGGAPVVHPMLTEEGFLISSGDNNVTALDIESGSEVWKTSLNHSSSLTNRRFGKLDNVITGSVLRRVMAWDIFSGEELWSIDFEEPMTWSNFTGLSVTVENFITYGREGDLYIISPEGTLQIKNYEARVYDSIMNSSILYLNQARSNSAVFTAINTGNGEIVWQQEYKGFGFPAYAPPIVENDILYVGTTGGPTGSKNGFFALDAQTGEEIWRREGIFTYSAVLVENYLYIHDASGIYKLNKSDGSIEWYSDFNAGNGTAPIDYGYGYIYAPHSGAMHVVDAETGEIVHRFSPPDGSFFWRVTAGEGRIFAQSSRHLYAFAPWGYEEALE